MSFFQSIKFRFIVACVAFSILVTLCYGWVAIYGLKINSDELFNWYITQEANKLLDIYIKNPNVDLGALTSAQVRITTEQEIIVQLKEFFNNPEINNVTLHDVPLKGPIFTTPQGYTIYEFSQNKQTIHILEHIFESKQSDNFYYIVDVSDFINYDSHSEMKLKEMFLEMLAIIIVIALVIGFMLAKTVISPLSRLARNVDNIDYNKKRLCHRSYFNDEIALLAGKIDSFVDKTNAFIEREKAFTRDASHELRTPVASSRAAIELALSLPEGQQGKVHNYLRRVERANKDMTHLIETFLMLGRDNDDNELKNTFNLHPLAENAFVKHDYLKRNSDIQYINNIPKDMKITSSKHYLAIILDNLVRNALQHTLEGSVAISMQDNQLTVQDTGEGFRCDDSDGSADSQLNVMKKSGVGLTIVRRLCERQGWRLTISPNQKQGTCAAIKFN